MEMKVNSQRIKSEREKRAWSQEHLADVANLGPRTVQRIETTGSASYESTRALASALGMDISDLLLENSTSSQTKRQVSLLGVSIGALAASLLLISSFFFAQPIFAKAVKLDFEVSVDNKLSDVDEAPSRLRDQKIVDDTKTTTIQLPNQLASK